MTLLTMRLGRFFVIAASLFAVSVAGCKAHKYNATVQNANSHEIIAKQFQNKFPLPQGVAKLPIHTSFDVRAWIDAAFPMQWGAKTEVLPLGHPATAVASAFVKKAHAGFLRAFPNARNIPEPQVVVINMSQSNAFVVPVAYCVPVQVVSDKVTEPGSWMGIVNGVIVNSKDAKERFRITDASSACPSWAISRPELAPQVAEAIQRRSSTCDVRFESGKIQLKHDCLELFNAGKSSPGVIVLASGAGIVVNSGTMRNLGEGQFEAVLAHELGHYYRAHGVGHILRLLEPGSKEFSFSYIFKTFAYTNRNTRPLEINSQEAEGMNEALRNLRDVTIVAKLPGAKLHPMTVKYAAMMVSEMQIIHEAIGERMPVAAEHVCPQYLAKLQGLTLLEGDFGRWKNYKSQYMKVEQLALECVRLLSLRSIESFRQPLAAAGKSERFASFSDLMTSLADYKPAVNAQEVLSHLEVWSQKTELEWNPITERARKMGFGVYNSETEADEFAAYLLAMAGSDPRETINLFFQFLADKENDAATAGKRSALPSLRECRMGYMNSWNHWVFNNQPWVPFFGATNDPHPDECFRIWNVDTETRSFGLPPSIEGRKSSAEYLEAVRALPPPS